MSMWMQKAAAKMKKKGTKGAFSAAARRAGEGTQEYAHQVKSDPNASTKLKRRANFAINASKAKH